MHLRMTFAKTTAMRYTGHLDVQRALERTFRRARLPLSYSQGFSPHPKLALAAPLALGFTSEGELADFWLDDELALDEIQTKFTDACPPGLAMISLENVQTSQASLQSRVLAAEYRVTSPEIKVSIIPEINQMMGEERILRVRRQKEYDLRPLILSISTVLAAEDENPYLLMCLSASDAKTGRPDEVLNALHRSPQRAHIHRTKLILRN